MRMLKERTIKNSSSIWNSWQKHRQEKQKKEFRGELQVLKAEIEPKDMAKTLGKNFKWCQNVCCLVVC